MIVANTQNLACLNCKEFLDTDKLCPDNRFQSDYHGSYPTDSNHIMHTIKDIQENFLQSNPDHYWGGIIDQLHSFLSIHSSHRLMIVKDGGSPPWFDEYSNWYDWKKIGLSKNETDDIEWPRNIIEDLNIVEWKKALKHYRENCIFVDTPEELEEHFLRHLNQLKHNSS